LILQVLEKCATSCVAKDIQHGKVISTTLLDIIPEVLSSMLGGNRNISRDELIRHLSSYFRRNAKLLVDIIGDTIAQDPTMRKVIFSSLVDVHAIERGLLLQNVQLKYGGRIPNKRWKLKFSPVLQATV